MEPTKLLSSLALLFSERSALTQVHLHDNWHLPFITTHGAQLFTQYRPRISAVHFFEMSKVWLSFGVFQAGRGGRIWTTMLLFKPWCQTCLFCLLRPLFYRTTTHINQPQSRDTQSWMFQLLVYKSYRMPLFVTEGAKISPHRKQTNKNEHRFSSNPTQYYIYSLFV